ncbi:hypothetical protein ACOSQ3_008809 [Xanthoceras sorbifolium]
MPQVHEQMIKISVLSTLLVLSFQLIPTAFSHTKPIPSDSSKLKSWIGQNIREFLERKSQLTRGKNATAVDEFLARAEDGFRVITVNKHGGRGDFTTVSAAVKSIPSGNKRRVIVKIGGGEYWEKITIDSSKKFITLYGDPYDMPRIVYNGTAFEYGTVYSATVAVESDYFMAVNVAFVNSAPMPDGKRVDAQAVAMRISGDKAAFHNCKFIGYQDTLCDDRGRHFFRDCYIQGTVDFIFGNGKSLYLNTTIKSVAEGMGVITAQARENVTDKSGFAFVHCNITGTGDTYLGRAWKERPRVVFAYTYMGTLINSEGWSDGSHPERANTVYYGEYKCMGPGATSSGRVRFAKILSKLEAMPFLSMTYLNGNKWLLPPPKL